MGVGTSGEVARFDDLGTTESERLLFENGGTIETTAGDLHLSAVGTDGYIIFNRNGSEIARWDGGGSNRLLFPKDDDATIQVDNSTSGAGKSINLIASDGLDNPDGYDAGNIRLYGGDGGDTGGPGQGGDGGSIQLVGGDGGTGTLSSSDGNVEFWASTNRVFYLDGTSLEMRFDSALSSAAIRPATTTSGAGMSFQIVGQQTTAASQAGGSILVQGGASSSGVGGTATLQCGNSSSASKSGLALVRAGSNSGSGDGGNVLIDGGSAGSGDGGDVTIDGGSSTSGTDGSVVISSASAELAKFNASGSHTVTGSLAISAINIISDSLTGSATAYNPTGWATAYLVRIDPDGYYDLDGLVSSSVDPVKVLANVSSTYDVTLGNEEAGASAANRIITGTGGDLVLGPNKAATIVYDSTSERWRVVSNT
jgi:hypothetical protein